MAASAVLKGRSRSVVGAVPGAPWGRGVAPALRPVQHGCGLLPGIDTVGQGDGLGTHGGADRRVTRGGITWAPAMSRMMITLVRAAYCSSKELRYRPNLILRLAPEVDCYGRCRYRHLLRTKEASLGLDFNDVTEKKLMNTTFATVLDDQPSARDCASNVTQGMRTNVVVHGSAAWSEGDVISRVHDVGPLSRRA
jgi:hypothetical protein